MRSSRLAGRVDRLLEIDRIGGHGPSAQLVEQRADGGGGAGAVVRGGALAARRRGRGAGSGEEAGAVAGQRLEGRRAEGVLHERLGQRVPQRQARPAPAAPTGPGQDPVEVADRARVLPAQGEVDAAVFQA